MLWKKETDSPAAMYVDLFRDQSAEIEVEYILHKISQNNGITKDDAIAEELRKRGNEIFKNDRFIDAMKYYNESLCFAENGSKTVGLAYANRSSCFLKLKMFKKCLADIELATQNQYPPRLMKKLENRKNDCVELMLIEDDQGDSSAPKLDFDANEQFPCLANVVNIERSGEFGHRVVATTDIGIGKAVVAEQCYFGVTKSHYEACNICLKEVQNFVPCKKCTNSLFCPDCKGNNLHEVECKINFGCSNGYTLMDVVRSISLAKNSFTSVKELIACVENMLENDTDNSIDLANAQSKYRAFFQLCPDWRIYPSPSYLQQTYLFYRLLLEQAEMAAFFRTNAHRRFLMHLIQHHIVMILHGSFNKRFAPIGGEGITDTYINIVAKQFNHSCMPNVCHALKGGSISCTAIRPIKKGEEIFISYLTLNDFASEERRRQKLKERVDCTCVRCKRKLKSDRQMELDSNFECLQSLFNIKYFNDGLYDRKQIDEMKEKCFSFLEKYERQECSFEMCRVLDVLYLLFSK